MCPDYTTSSSSSHAAAKQRYFDHVYADSVLVRCQCGCGGFTKNRDRYGRPVHFINGHNNRKYGQPNQYQWEYVKRDPERRRLAKNRMHHRRKAELVIRAGGECVGCNLKYDGTNAAVFQFHHRQDEVKSFALASNITRYNRVVVYAEADKCDLVCANCHFLIHSEEY
jgi:hypothetical protein